ncbi:retrotransposon protein, putative, ty1-copia subclass [Tanacetum coccineum]
MQLTLVAYLLPTLFTRLSNLLAAHFSSSCSTAGPASYAPEILAAHTAWVKGSKKIVGLMLMTMDSEIQRNLENLHAYDMLQELKTLSRHKLSRSFFRLLRFSLLQPGIQGSPVSSDVQKKKGGYIEQTRAVWAPRWTLGLSLHEANQLCPKNNAPALPSIQAGKVQKGHLKKELSSVFIDRFAKRRKKMQASRAGGSEEDTHPSIDTSLNHEEDDLEIDEPQSDIIPIRRSTRTRHALDRFVNPKYPNRVCKLKHSIYGLKQASRQWNKRFDDEIKKFGFTQNRDEPCVYLKASGSNVTFLILYVDDILIMGNNIPMLQDVKSYLGRCFAMKDLGEAAYILGIKIYRDRS